MISYLVAAYTTTNYKWGFFAFGTIAWILLAFSTLEDGRAGASRVGITRDYFLLAGWINLLWLLYPIAWGLSDGGNKINVTSGFIFFGILDGEWKPSKFFPSCRDQICLLEHTVLLIPLPAFATIGLATKWDYGKLNLHFTQYGRVARGGSLPEKEAAAPAAGVVGEQA